ncbi:MAG: avidin/streptavidin family protein [Pseudomonadota bacterium]
MNNGPHDIDGTWVNQNGSTMVLTVHNGTISGHYRSAKGRSVVGKDYGLVGIVNGDVLTFGVSWQDDEDNKESVTSFAGRLERADGDVVAIHTLWILARRWEDEQRTRETGAWNAFLTNADVFRRTD